MISVLLTIAIFGFIVYLITLIPMPPVFRNVVLAVAVLILIIFILQFAGVPMHLGGGFRGLR